MKNLSPKSILVIVLLMAACKKDLQFGACLPLTSFNSFHRRKPKCASNLNAPPCNRHQSFIANSPKYGSACLCQLWSWIGRLLKKYILIYFHMTATYRLVFGLGGVPNREWHKRLYLINYQSFLQIQPQLSVPRFKSFVRKRGVRDSSTSQTKQHVQA
jgi:hypothetical protein